MASKSAPNQYGFNSGELSPWMANRSDTDRYGYGAKRMRNFVPMLQGPARKRAGTKFAADCMGECWAVPFVYSQTDAYILLFRNNSVRFVSDHGYVLEATKSIASATKANPCVIGVTSHGYSNGDQIEIENAGGMTELNGRTFLVANVTTHTFSLTDLFGTAINSSAFTTFTSGGTVARVYTLASPYSIADLTDSATGCCKLSYTQSDDTFYLCVPGYAVRKLVRSSAASWAFSTLDQVGGPFETVDPDQTVTVYASAATGSVTLTASASTFASTDVGRLFLLEIKSADANGAWETGKAITLGAIVRSQGHYYECTDAGTTGTIVPSHTEGARYDGADTSATVQWTYRHSGYGWAKITAYTSATEVTATVQSRIPDMAVGSGNATTNWAFGSWGGTEGHPEHVAFFRERLWFFRGTRAWGSVPSDFENFSERDAGVVADDSAIAIDIRSGMADEIQWVMPSSDLLIGTQSGEFSVGEISTSDPLGPGNIAALAGPGYGSRRVRPAKINDSIMYVQNAGRTLRELRFALETDGYQSADRTAFAEHIARGQINQMAYAKEPQSILWSCCANGDLIGMSFQREHNLLAWHKHPLGGSFNSGEAFARSVAVIPSPEGNRDETYVVVKRTINGATKYYLEYITADWEPEEDDLEDMFYVDAGLSYDSSSATTIRGLDHLEGQTVNVLADGHDVGTKTVSGYQITLSTAASVVQVGLSYTATLQSMNLARPGFVTRFAKAFVHFYGTLGAAFGSLVRKNGREEGSTQARTINFTNASTVISAPTPAFSGIKMTEGTGTGTEVHWTIEHNRPTACAVLGVISEMAQTEEKA